MSTDDRWPDDIEALLTELEERDALAGTRARQLLSPSALKAAPAELLGWIVATARRARSAGLGALEDAGASGRLSALVLHAAQHAKLDAAISGVIDPTWTTAGRVRDVLAALEGALDHADELEVLHDAALSILELRAEKPPTTQREFLERVLQKPYRSPSTHHNPRTSAARRSRGRPCACSPWSTTRALASASALDGRSLCAMAFLISRR